MAERTPEQMALDVGKVFTPAVPVSDSSFFAGRKDEIRRLVDAINQRGSSGWLRRRPMFRQNDAVPPFTTRPMPDALALEYQGEYGTARRDLDIADLVNNPAANGICRVFGLGFQEEGLDLLSGQTGSLFKNLPDPLLIRHD